MVQILLTSKRSTFFDSFSPAPIVFSYGRYFKKRDIPVRIQLVSISDALKDLRLNKTFYRKVKGPHHYKLIFYDYLRMPKVVKSSRYKIFVDNFLCKQNINGENIKIVNIYWGKKLYKTYECIN